MPDSIIQTDLKVTGDLTVGNTTVPAKISAGSGAMDAANKADGSLHMRNGDNVLPEIRHNAAVAKLGLAQAAVEARTDDLSAGAAITYTTYMPSKAKITGVSRRFTTKPASASGTVVTGITVDGNQILASAAEDEESISNDTLTAHNLTATSADLLVGVGTKVVITVTSDNGDMTGGTDPMFYIYYETN